MESTALRGSVYAILEGIFVFCQAIWTLSFLLTFLGKTSRLLSKTGQFIKKNGAINAFAANSIKEKNDPMEQGVPVLGVT
jgi:uncharacterized membrane protein YkgB